MKNPISILYAKLFKMSPPFHNKAVRLASLLTIIYFVTVALGVIYYFLDGNFIALLGGLIVNLVTIMILLGGIDIIYNIIILRFKAELDDYKEEHK